MSDVRMMKLFNAVGCWGCLILPLMYYLFDATVGVRVHVENLWLLPIGWAVGFFSGTAAAVIQEYEKR